MLASNQSTTSPPGTSVHSGTQVSLTARIKGCIPAILIVFAGGVAYLNSFSAPFIFDDVAITDNPDVKTLWPPWAPFLPIHRPGYATERRPIANFSVAVNYALGGTNVWGYHALNLAAHLWSGIILFYLIRRTLLLPSLRGQWTSYAATSVALTTALIWTVHPVLTNAVTYIIQRTEVLAGLFCLLSFYCMLRGSEAQRPTWWYACAVACSFLAMGSKESVAALPFLAAAYDRLFLCDSWGQVIQRHSKLYVGLCGAWLVPGLFLIYGIVFREHVDQSILNQREAYVWSDWILAQFESIALYVRLSFWPHPLILDYGFGGPRQLSEVAPSAVFVLLLVIAIGAALRWRPQLGFLGIWFFAILAPSSSIIPIYAECAAEKRMYLPLAAVILLSVLAVRGLSAQLKRRSIFISNYGKSIAVCGYAITALTVITCVFLTRERNLDYIDELRAWDITVRNRPGNTRALANLGYVYVNRRDTKNVKPLLKEAIKIRPNYEFAHRILGIAEAIDGNTEAAFDAYTRSIELMPDQPRSYAGRAMLFLERKDFSGAANDFAEAVKHEPDSWKFRLSLACALRDSGELERSLAVFNSVAEFKPSESSIYWHRAKLRARLGQFDAAEKDLSRFSQLLKNESESQRAIARFWQSVKDEQAAKASGSKG